MVAVVEVMLLLVLLAGNNGGQASGTCGMHKSPHIPGVQSTSNTAQSSLLAIIQWD